MDKEKLQGVPKEDGVFKLPRFEWSVWKPLKAVPSLDGIVYGDYGIKHSVFAEAPFAGTVSLKYTTENHYIIYRGELSEPHPLGHGQYIVSAKKLVKSPHYLGKLFSWGDLRFYELSQENENDNEKRKTGNPTNWVQQHQNHHITLLHNILP